MGTNSVLGLVFCMLQLCAAAAGATALVDYDYGCSDGEAWAGTHFESLVSFGDSYTDSNRLYYFIFQNGSAPPPGWIDPGVNIPKSPPLLSLFFSFSAMTKAAISFSDP